MSWLQVPLENCRSALFEFVEQEGRIQRHQSMKTFVIRGRECRVLAFRVEAESEEDALELVTNYDDHAMQSQGDMFDSFEIMDVHEVPTRS